MSENTDSSVWGLAAPFLTCPLIPSDLMHELNHPHLDDNAGQPPERPTYQSIPLPSHLPNGTQTAVASPKVAQAGTWTPAVFEPISFARPVRFSAGSWSEVSLGSDCQSSQSCSPPSGVSQGPPPFSFAPVGSISAHPVPNTNCHHCSTNSAPQLSLPKKMTLAKPWPQTEQIWNPSTPLREEKESFHGVSQDFWMTRHTTGPVKKEGTHKPFFFTFADE